MNVTELTELTAVEAVAAMQKGEIRAETYAQALLQRAQALGHLNAFRSMDRDRVLETANAADKKRQSGAALGALHGLPMPVKDSLNTKDLPTTNGTRALRSFQPKDDAPILECLFRQGAILMGKTNLHEISFGWTSNNLAFGPVKNPYDANRISGGSSGGSATAVAGRMAPLAVAEDTHGSIRVPATMCGLTGLRPTFGRYPAEGILPLTINKFDQPGPLARSVADLVLFDSAVSGDFRSVEPKPLKGVRIGISPEFFLANADAEVDRIFNEALLRIEKAGATLVRAEVPEAVKKGLSIGLTIQFYEIIPAMSSFLKSEVRGITVEELLSQMSPNIDAIFRMFILPPNAVTPHAYQTALQEREQLKAAILEYFTENRIDALAFPPVLSPPPLCGDNVEFNIRGEKILLTTIFGRNTALGPCASMSCLVLPAGLALNGLPVGIEFDALPGQDRELLSLGLSFEKILGPIPAPLVTYPTESHSVLTQLQRTRAI